jgi:hypothetical protein
MLQGKLRYFFACLLLLGSFTVAGQFSPDFSKSWGWKEVFMPKIQPFMLIHPNTPGLALGLEIRPLRSLSIQAEYTLPFYALAFYNNNQGKYDQQFTRLRSEIRFYLDPNDDYEYYIALEGQYAQSKYYRLGEFILRDEKAFNYIRSDVQLTTLGATIKGGYQVAFRDWFILDAYVGAGLRSVNTQHTPIGLFEVPISRELEREGGDQFEGSVLRPVFTIGARIGFSFFPRY